MWSCTGKDLGSFKQQADDRKMAVVTGAVQRHLSLAMKWNMYEKVRQLRRERDERKKKLTIQKRDRQKKSSKCVRSGNAAYDSFLALTSAPFSRRT